MKKKKLALTVLAMVLICCLSITGTLAFLTDQQDGEDTVINTFIAAGGGEIIDPDIDPTPGPIPVPPKPLNPNFFLVEHVAEYVKPNYTLGDTLVTENDYDRIAPEMDADKDPTLYVNINNDVDAYIFVKVLDTTDGNLTYKMADGWTAVAGFTGVYAYTPAGGSIITGVDGFELTGVPLLKDNIVTAAETLKDVDTTTTDVMELGELKFQAFVCQAGGFADYTEAYTRCFGS